MRERKLFGTDGIRGKANTYPMTGEVAMALGRSVTHFFQSSGGQTRPLIIIGKDTRLSCYTLEQAFASGVCSQGGRAILTGPLPTPGVAFVTSSMRAQAGVMISASHNTFSDNGIKLFDSSGHKLPDSVELDLEESILDPSSLPTKTGGELGFAKRLDEVIGRYIVYVKSAFDSRYTLEKFRVVVDCAHGAAYKIAPMIFSELGADVISLGVSPNGQNINAGCGSMFPEFCAEHVRKYRADLGICLDGDADRIVIIDEKGEVVEGDKLIGLCGRFLKSLGKEAIGSEVVGTIMSNLGLEHYITKNLGLQFVRTNVGDRYIVEHMQRNGSLFGGEPSGHIIFKRHATTGDGILSALKVIEAMIHFGKPLSELIDEITLFPQVIKNVKVGRRPPFASVPGIAKALADRERALGDEGRILLRYSGTEAMARVMVEGMDVVKVRQYCDELSAIVEKELGELV